MQLSLLFRLLPLFRILSHLLPFVVVAAIAAAAVVVVVATANENEGWAARPRDLPRLRQPEIQTSLFEIRRIENQSSRNFTRPA